MTSRQHQKHAGDNLPTADRHNDKRVKLDQPAPQAHPFENVDYWLDFEPDQHDEARTETSFDSCFSQWLDASKVNENNIAPNASLCNDKPAAAGPAAPTMSSADPNDFLFFGTPTPDVDDALKLMNLGDPWDVVDQQQQGQQRNGLYSELFPPTPNSEDSPLQSQTYQPPTTLTPTTQPASLSSTPYLGDEEKLSLLSLALNLGPLNTSFLPSGPFDYGMSALCRDSPQSSTASEKNTKVNQKSSPKSAGAEKASSKSKARHVDRAAHNDIERRYRTNLKHKIAELRDAIPTLAGGDDEEGSGAEASSSKVSKGTVLTKATEYIHQLEQRNKAMEAQHQVLLRRLQAVEILLDPRRSSLAARMAVKNEPGTPTANVS
ncbi:helix-loop-helix DNA-binding domain-containing protein [Sarocladium implicatum]|nr:helix-loop-helix DNA-binding domain-containing protein [Sarocladium implicatum]